MCTTCSNVDHATHCSWARYENWFGAVGIWQAAPGVKSLFAIFHVTLTNKTFGWFCRRWLRQLEKLGLSFKQLLTQSSFHQWLVLLGSPTWRSILFPTSFEQPSQVCSVLPVWLLKFYTTFSAYRFCFKVVFDPCVDLAHVVGVVDAMYRRRLWGLDSAASSIPHVPKGITSCRILQDLDHHNQSTFLASCSIWFHCCMWLP